MTRGRERRNGVVRMRAKVDNDDRVEMQRFEFNDAVLKEAFVPGLTERICALVFDILQTQGAVRESRLVQD
jgi:hypothetical protein